ncbi:hypothetical protein NL676_029716 [Syzygium grande]|nr:hypothetical protein NL676_029716 [Syzygium grande]
MEAVIDFYGGLENSGGITVSFQTTPPMALNRLLPLIDITPLPKGMRAFDPTYLGISECLQLKRRCKRWIGEDWDKIAHIPRITRDFFFDF